MVLAMLMVLLEDWRDGDGGADGPMRFSTHFCYEVSVRSRSLTRHIPLDQQLNLVAESRFVEPSARPLSCG